MVILHPLKMKSKINRQRRRISRVGGLGSCDNPSGRSNALAESIVNMPPIVLKRTGGGVKRNESANYP